MVECVFLIIIIITMLSFDLYNLLFTSWIDNDDSNNVGCWQVKILSSKERKKSHPVFVLGSEINRICFI